jgi:hypothetical protein
MPRSARLVARVVLVPDGAGAADARRRVAEVLLRAAMARTEPPALAEPTPDPTPAASPPAGGDASCPSGHMATIRRPYDPPMNCRETVSLPTHSSEDPHADHP